MSMMTTGVAAGGLEESQTEFAALVERFAGYADGAHQTEITPLRLFPSSMPTKPIPGVYEPALCLDFGQMRELIAGMGLPEPEPPEASVQINRMALAAGCLDASLLDAVVRLLRLLAASRHIPVLAPMVLHKIWYLLLIGRHGRSCAGWPRTAIAMCGRLPWRHAG